MTNRIFRTLQWNIGGGLRRQPASDPLSRESYCAHDLEHILNVIDFIRELHTQRPEIITFQEAHQDEALDQVECLANAFGYEFRADPYADSHLEEDKKLCLGIMSLFPIKEHTYHKLENPKFSRTLNGKERTCNDKGLTRTKLNVYGRTLDIINLHLVPCIWYGINPLSKVTKEMRRNVITTMGTPSACTIAQGDFNYDDETLTEFLPSLFDEDGFSEVLQRYPTRPDGKRVDHVLYRGIHVVSSYVVAPDGRLYQNEILTDHYPIVTTFTIEGCTDNYLLPIIKPLPDPKNDRKCFTMH